jgi:CO dehydrogenase maturation factor
MKKIASIGRGGVGKTCFIAGLARVLAPKGPLLLIDADPDQNLAEALGLDTERDGVKSVSELLFDVKAGHVDPRIEKAPLAEKVDYLLSHHGLYEGEQFDLFSLGTKWSEGCYCQPNNILKGLIARLEGGYRFVLIDSPAGLEHLNRRITTSLDDIFAVIGGSKKALDNARRAKRITEEIRIRFKRFYLAAGYDYPLEKAPELASDPEFTYCGPLARDPGVARAGLEGGSVFSLPDDSPFIESVRLIARAAGYLSPSS